MITDKKLEVDNNSYVMMVDDEAYNCEVLKSMLICLGVEPERIIVCMGGKQALKKCKEIKKENKTLKLLLTDLSMPIMDGYKFIKKFRKVMGGYQEIPTLVVAITGHAESGFFLKALNIGADNVYSKPILSD